MMQQTQKWAANRVTSANSLCANPDEDWTKISDFEQRRRIQSRIAQRKYRMKGKERLRQLEKQQADQEPAGTIVNAGIVQPVVTSPRIAPDQFPPDRSQQQLYSPEESLRSETLQHEFPVLDSDTSLTPDLGPLINTSLLASVNTFGTRSEAFVPPHAADDGQAQRSRFLSSRERANSVDGRFAPTGLLISPASSAAGSERELAAPSTVHTPPSGVEHRLRTTILTECIDAYFTYNHAMMPIFSETSFRASLSDKSGCLNASRCEDNSSRMLLCAVLYAGAVHVADSAIHRGGFECRQECLDAFYARAKTLFFMEEDHEAPGALLARVQTALLLHTMWPAAATTMDPWTWLGFAIRLGQKMGMHRDASGSSLPNDEWKLWRRIWWSLFVSDTQLASDLKKPLMINISDCDVERLTIDDFEPTFSVQARMLIIEQVTLSEIRAKIVSKMLAPSAGPASHTREHQSALLNEITDWRTRVGPHLDSSESQDPASVPLQVMLLEVSYSRDVLLLHESFITGTGRNGVAPDGKLSWKAAVQATDVISQITELIMNYKSLLHCPGSYPFALLAAISIHYLRGPRADQHLKLYMIALRTLSTMYGIGGVIRGMFLKLEKHNRMKAQQPEMAGNSRNFLISDLSSSSSVSATPRSWGLIEQPAGEVTITGGNAEPEISECWMDFLNNHGVFI